MKTSVKFALGMLVILALVAFVACQKAEEPAPAPEPAPVATPAPEPTPAPDANAPATPDVNAPAENAPAPAAEPAK